MSRKRRGNPVGGLVIFIVFIAFVALRDCENKGSRTGRQPETARRASSTEEVTAAAALADIVFDSDGEVSLRSNFYIVFDHHYADVGDLFMLAVNLTISKSVGVSEMMRPVKSLRICPICFESKITRIVSTNP